MFQKIKKNEPDVIIIPLHSPSEKCSSILTPTEIKCSESKQGKNEDPRTGTIEDLEKQSSEMTFVSESFKQEVIVETNKILQLLKIDASIDDAAMIGEAISKEKSLEKRNMEEFSKVKQEIKVAKTEEKADINLIPIVKDQLEECVIEKKGIDENKLHKPTNLQLETKCIKQIEEFAMSKSSSEKSKEEIKVTPEGETRTDNAIVITPDDIESESLLAKHTSDSGK